ncbi:Thioredoxin Y, chloroplastic [Zostera marina]|uniref:Thioredoxin Y n=1 Tax=Zostera marina TaxID=29655 RepID=A0A0K9P5S5_ZOSMR|nr:thioredoxin Y [Zostera marina]KMZ64363.1 Thioredoxin Y, chloroplastic [Zostera marina]
MVVCSTAAATLAMSSSCTFYPSIPIESSRFSASRSLSFLTPRFYGGIMKEIRLSIGGTGRRILPKVEAHNQTFNSFDDLLQMTDKPVLVDFYATWCGPCKYMVGVLEEVSAKMGDRIQVVKIDTEKYTEISNSYGIEALPTFIIFNKGKPCNRFEGALSVDKLIDHIEQVLATLS